MNAIIASDVGEFFAPTQYGAIDMLLAEHGEMRQRIERLAELVATEGRGAVHFFAKAHDLNHRGWIDTGSLFATEPAIKALDAHFWRRALDLSGVRDLLPQDKRDGWDKDIEKHATPPFAEEWVTPTIRDLLDGRERFFLEKVDGIFRALSGSHVTNRPEGFGIRFIFEYAFSANFAWSQRSDPTQRFRGYLHDLRMVIGKFMGHPDPEWGATYNALCGVGRDGQWQSLDGGTIRIRGYKKGTAHVEIHPDMAWRLNAVLAKLHPRAIPSQHREPPKKRHREWAPIERVLPDKVRHHLAMLRPSAKDGRHVWLGEIDDKHLRAHVVDVLRSIGMDRDGNFAYDVRAALEHLIRVGTMPDETTHQYYPTPDEMARELVAALEIQPGDRCLEPSAGRGAIAVHMPSNDTTCVELAELNSIILESQGFSVDRGDFLDWAKYRPHARYNAIAMNPPYSQGRAEIHVQAAAGLLARGGRLGAILPASLAGRELVKGAASHEWSEPMSFDGVSVKVCRYVARMPA